MAMKLLLRCPMRCPTKKYPLYKKTLPLRVAFCHFCLQEVRHALGIFAIHRIVLFHVFSQFPIFSTFGIKETVEGGGEVIHIIKPDARSKLPGRRRLQIFLWYNKFRVRDMHCRLAAIYGV